MARFLFVSLPLHGHLDWGGMLATAAALTRYSTHQITWASGAEVAATIVHAGVPWIEVPSTGWKQLPDLPAGLPADQLAELRKQRAVQSWLSPAAVVPAAAHLREVLVDWHPDVVVVEPYAAAATLAAEASGLPIAVCGRPALPDPDKPLTRTPASPWIHDLCEQVGVPGRYWDLSRAQIRSPFLHVDYFARRWYADLPAVAPQTIFAGTKPDPGPVSQDPPRVLITLGSLFHTDPAFFRIAAEAVMLEGGLPLVVTGDRSSANAGERPLPGLPAGCDIRNWIDFDTVMPTLTAVVHHGGVGTTHAALRHGLPQVAVPHAGDQQAQAGRITQAGVGFGVRPVDFTPANARWLVRQLLSNATLHARATAWQNELQALGGTATAAQTLEAAFSQSRFVV